jgi:hypothetical protein
MSRSVRLIAIGLLGALVFAACGGSDNGSSDTGGDGGTVVSESASADTGGTTGGGVIDVSDCAAVGAAMASAGGAFASAVGGDASQMQAAVDQLQGYVDQVPDEIKDDLNTVATSYQQYVQAMADSGYDPTSGQAPTAEQLAAISAAGDAMSTDEFTTASDNVSAWLDANCGG